jgi:hypothetical protein
MVSGTWKRRGWRCFDGMFVLLVRRGHSCPRNLATSTNSEVRSGTSTARNFKCATDPCRREGIIVCEAFLMSTASFRRYEYRRLAAALAAGRTSIVRDVSNILSLYHSLAKHERWFSNTVFMTTVRSSIYMRWLSCRTMCTCFLQPRGMLTVGLSFCRKSFGPSRGHLRAASIS